MFKESVLFTECMLLDGFRIINEWNCTYTAGTFSFHARLFSFLFGWNGTFYRNSKFAILLGLMLKNNHRRQAYGRIIIGSITSLNRTLFNRRNSSLLLQLFQHTFCYIRTQETENSVSFFVIDNTRIFSFYEMYRLPWSKCFAKNFRTKKKLWLTTYQIFAFGMNWMKMIKYVAIAEMIWKENTIQIESKTLSLKLLISTGQDPCKTIPIPRIALAPEVFASKNVVP